MANNVSKSEIFEKYKKLSGRRPPIVMGIHDEVLQETVQLILSEQFIEGYKLGKKKYKRFKNKFLTLRCENEKLREENTKLKEDNEKLHDKQIACINRLNMMEVLDKSISTGTKLNEFPSEIISSEVK